MLAVVLAVAGVVCVVQGVRADPAPAVAQLPTPPGRTLRTPLWSPRRVPALFVDAVATARLRHALHAVIAPVNGCVAVADGSDSLVAVNPTRPLAAASTQKLLVAAAALSALGPAHPFSTRAVSAAARRGDELTGDLFVVGGGDPVLTSQAAPSPPATRLSDLADAIVHAGIRRIDGALVADDSRFDRERLVPDWKPSEIAEGDVGALGALVVDGGYAIGGRTPSSDPALDTVQQLGDLLQARGVQISGGERDADAPPPTTAHEVARVTSPPLAAIVEQMLTVSNNETAELLTRAVDVATGGAGSTVAGTKAVRTVLARHGVPVPGIDLHDGSGLAPDDRVTCAALLRVIELSARPEFAAIDRGLAIAGQTGTLAFRFAGTPLAGHLRAKTGHIDGVVGLAGLISGARPGVEPRFAFIANGAFSTDDGARLQDDIATTIGTYPNAPAAAQLVPAPLPPA